MRADLLPKRLLWVIVTVVGSLLTTADRSMLATAVPTFAAGDGHPDEIDCDRHDSASAADAHRVREAYGKRGLYFEANRGQTDSQVKFLARGGGYTLFLTSTDAVLTLTRPDSRIGAVLRTRIVGANPDPRITGQQALPGRVNYFLGNDPTKWRTNVPTYARVHYGEIYPGIDLMYYGTERALEYDFVVGPGADPRRIVLSFRGADRLDVDAAGDLVLQTAAGAVRQRKPIIYQDGASGRREIPGGYALKGESQVGFHVADYDASQPLVIDPVLDYSTYLGGSDDEQGLDIAVDDAGHAYVTGTTSSVDFPATPGAFQPALAGPFVAFVTKLNSSGTGLAYSTYLGGSGGDRGLGIAVDDAGLAYVTGSTGSVDFPITPGAFQPVLRGSPDGFVTKLESDGSALVYSSYLGGNGVDQGHDIAIDDACEAFVTGQTDSRVNFPTTPDAFDTTLNGIVSAFITKVNATGTALVYSTYLGSGGETSGTGIAVDEHGNAYVTGANLGPFSDDFPTTPNAFDTTFNGGFFSMSDAFVTKLNETGTALVYSTFLGGGRDDFGEDIAVDRYGRAYVVGRTDSTDFPTSPRAFQTALGGFSDAFVTALNKAGSALVYSTYLGGSRGDLGFGIAVSGKGAASVTGRTHSTDFPTTANAIQPAASGGISDAFVTRLHPTGRRLIHSTYLGGSGEDTGNSIDVDGYGRSYIVGVTDSADFPTTPGAFHTTFNGGFRDAFVTRIADPVRLSVSTGIGRGSVTSDPNGIACGPTCSAWYQLGITVKLTATPVFGSIFTGWHGCDSVYGELCGVTMSKARSVTAGFFGILLW